MKVLGISIVFLSLSSVILYFLGYELPTLRWFFSMGNYEVGEFKDRVTIPVFGLISHLLLISLGVWLFFKKKLELQPITKRRIARFRAIGRGFWSLVILAFLLVFASLDQLVVGNEALIVKYNGEYFFPALKKGEYKMKDFGDQSSEKERAVNYRQLNIAFEKSGEKDNWVLMPLVPYAPVADKTTAVTESLEVRDGIVYDTDTQEPYSGLAATLYDIDDPASIHMRYKYRKGIRRGTAVGRDRNGATVFKATYVYDPDTNAYVESNVSFEGLGDVEDFKNLETSPLLKVLYNPSGPNLAYKHYLGTDSEGNDIFAAIYGGLQVNFKAAIIFVPVVYALGLSIGLVMGFFGGWVDIIVQRLIEIFSNIPFLFVILILSGLLPEDKRNLGMILILLIVFGWMGMTYVMRTAALKEKARDYVAAARVMGAGTPRIIFKHILPNSVAILVTLVPFSISGIILSLTSLDYLGFGLPANKYATWGTLLKDGLANPSSPWIVMSAFTMLVTLLVLVTFIGEAIREAFDPKKFTTYK